MSRVHARVLAWGLAAVLLSAATAEAQNYNIMRRIAHDAVDNANSRGGAAPQGQPAEEPAAPAAVPAKGPQAKPATAPATMPASAPGVAPATEVDQVAFRADYVAYHQGADFRAQVKLTNVDPQGQKTEAQFALLRRDIQDYDPAKDALAILTQPVYIYFFAPAEAEKTALFAFKQVGRPNDCWLYQPSQPQEKQLTPAEMRTSFAGSQWSYDDIIGRSHMSDTHEMIEAECTPDLYVVKNTPKQADAVDFSSRKLYIHRKSLVVIRAVYFDKQAEPKPYRQYDTLEVKPDEPLGFYTVTKARMTDLKTGAYSELELSDVKYNLNLPKEIFGKHSLRAAPMKYLK